MMQHPHWGRFFRALPGLVCAALVFSVLLGMIRWMGKPETVLPDTEEQTAFMEE